MAALKHRVLLKCSLSPHTSDVTLSPTRRMLASRPPRREIMRKPTTTAMNSLQFWNSGRPPKSNGNEIPDAQHGLLSSVRVVERVHADADALQRAVVLDDEGGSVGEKRRQRTFPPIALE
jgi:hypothetical protein